MWKKCQKTHQNHFSFNFKNFIGYKNEFFGQIDRVSHDFFWKSGLGGLGVIAYIIFFCICFFANFAPFESYS